MKKIFFAVCLLLSACREKADVPIIRVLNTGGMEAVGAYLTRDQQGNPVLCWSEQDGKDSLYRLKYAIYNDQTDKFNSPITVSVSAGSSISPESMGKIAFKADGTVIAVFAKAFEHEKNPYAGAIYYSMSADRGKSWSRAQYLHSDTSHTYGRSFFDVTNLKNGELAAVWLDGRYGKAIKGLALFFARTEKGKGFEKDTCLDKGTCECCRTDLLTDAAGDIHLAYRSITFPSALSGKQVRDMVYQQSADNGLTFSKPKPISNDNWEIDGCPHSGPTLAVVKGAVHAVWFTAGGGAGLYYANAAEPAVNFGTRNLLTVSGRHPQMVALPDGNLAMVCEESLEAQSEAPMHMESGHDMDMSHAATGLAKIVLRVLKQGKEEKRIMITEGHEFDNHAVLTTLNKDLLLAWVREENGHSKICYSRVEASLLR